MEKILFAFLLLTSCKNIQPVVQESPVQAPVVEEQYDGPYVQYIGNQVWVNYIDESNGVKKIKRESAPARKKDDLKLKVMTDIPGKTFNVDLKKQLKNEPVEFASPPKLLVL